ncbi:hypothetical protein ABNG02_08015 [Halorubrum ejinorense]|uniref:Oxidoreductase n=1 Tax=Halorubrum ejinorense TaxID=425309 RepID=A0AAV3SVF0_9EURY
MGLRCLLGHDFDEPELQREREEDGDEVVTTVREVKTCARCGETQVVSENTEVTTMQQLADEAAADRTGESDPGGPAGPATTPGAAEEPAGRSEPNDAPQESVTLDEEPGAGADDAVILDDGATADADDGGPGAASGGAEASAVDDSPGTAGSGPSEEDAELLDAGDGAAAGGGAGAGEAPATDAASDDEPDAETDDGVILDEDDDESVEGRERGAWPEVDEEDAEGDGAAAWPDHGGEDEGFSAEVGEGGDAGVEFGGGLTPEAAEQEEADGEGEYVEAPDDSESVSLDADGEGGTGITRSESPELQTAGSNEPTEYYCPECGMVRASDGSSMRAGDICPECKRGYVDERPR